ncbi:MAG TPA: helix-turn-helix domain-containing protein [Gemmatimonadaceae bacterium]
MDSTAGASHTDSDITCPAHTCAEHCPPLIRRTLDLIAAKWTVPIFLNLHVSPTPLRYAALQRRLGGITAKELAKNLRQLVAAGVIHRQVYATVPPRVEYSLTELGESLFPILEHLAGWGTRIHPLCAEG